MPGRENISVNRNPEFKDMLLSWKLEELTYKTDRYHWKMLEALSAALIKVQEIRLIIYKGLSNCTAVG